MGKVYQQKEEWEQAAEFYQKSLEIGKKMEDIYRVAKTWRDLGFLYEAQGEGSPTSSIRQHLSSHKTHLKLQKNGCIQN